MSNIPSDKRDSFLKFILLIGILLICWQLGRFFHFSAQSFEIFFKQFPIWISGPVFVFLFVLLTFFIWFSKDLLRLAAAILYGPYASTILIYFGELINAYILFHLSRKLGREFVAGMFKGGAKHMAKVGEESSAWWQIFILRLTPIVPFRFLDLGYGLTNVSFKRYLIVIAFATLPRLFFIQFVLAGLGYAVLEEPTKIVPLLIEYLNSNVHVLKWCALYVFGSIGMLFFLKRKVQ